MWARVWFGRAAQGALPGRDGGQATQQPQLQRGGLRGVPRLCAASRLCSEPPGITARQRRGPSCGRATGHARRAPAGPIPGMRRPQRVQPPHPQPVPLFVLVVGDARGAAGQ